MILPPFVFHALSFPSICYGTNAVSNYFDTETKPVSLNSRTAAPYIFTQLD
jgi:hypothetical protein